MQTFTDAVLDQIKIIGFQSVLRPFKQTAMALDVSATGAKEFFTAWELPKDYAVSSAVYEHFFKGKCTEKFNKKRNITIFHCDENFDVTGFKNITFILKDINLEFTLTYEDLFINYLN